MHDGPARWAGLLIVGRLRRLSTRNYKRLWRILIFNKRRYGVLSFYGVRHTLHMINNWVNNFYHNTVPLSTFPDRHCVCY